MSRIRDPKAFGPLLFTLALFFVPLFTKDTFILFTLTSIFVYVVLCSTFRFITITGDWTFAHVIMMGVGSYTSAILTMKFGMTFFLTMFIGGFVAVVLALLLYSIANKTKLVTYFWVTWALGEIIRQIWLRFPNPFGGISGFTGVPAPAISFFGQDLVFKGQTPYYILGLALMVVILVFLYMVEKSRVGLTLKALDQNLDLSASLGINLNGHRMLAVIIGTFCVGMMGAFYAHWTHYIAPADFDVTLGLFVLLYVVVGGSKTFWGPIVGTVLFVLLGVWLRPLQEYILAIYGVILMLVLIVFREGLESLPNLIAAKIKNNRQKEEVR